MDPPPTNRPYEELHRDDPAFSKLRTSYYKIKPYTQYKIKKGVSAVAPHEKVKSKVFILCISSDHDRRLKYVHSTYCRSYSTVGLSVTVV